MTKIFQKFDNSVNDVERVIINETTAIHERIEIARSEWNGVVWKTYQDDIIKDYKWSNVRDYVRWIKQLGFKEVEESESTIVTLNNKEFKKYQNFSFIN